MIAVICAALAISDDTEFSQAYRRSKVLGLYSYMD